MIPDVVEHKVTQKQESSTDTYSSLLVYLDGRDSGNKWRGSTFLWVEEERFDGVVHDARRE